MTAANRRGAERIGGEGLHGVDLFGRPHGPDLGGDGGGYAPGQHQGGEHGAKLARNPQGHDLGHDLLGVEAPAAGIDVQRQGRAGEDGGQTHHGQGQIADGEGLANKLAAEKRRAQTAADPAPGEQGQPSGLAHQAKGGASDRAQGIHRPCSR